MPIEIKELIVRAWIGSQAGSDSGSDDDESVEVADRGSEVPQIQTDMLEQMKRMMSDNKER